MDWRGCILEQHRLQGFETRDVVWINNVVAVYLGQATEVEFKEGNHYVSRTMYPGQVSIRPAELCTSARSRQTTEFVSVSLDSTFMSMAGLEMGGLHDLRLKRVDGVEDPLIKGLCLALREEASAGGVAGRLYSETLATSLAVHLATKYNARKESAGADAQGFSPRAVRHAIDYIQEHLGEDISLKNIATAAGLSPFHFARMFKSAMGLAPYQFVIQKRIEKAKHLLMAGRHTLAAIAIETGFADQSHLTHHFKRACGITPKVFLTRCRSREHYSE